MVETNQLNIGWGTQDSVQLRYFSGWILWFMEDVTNYCENWMRLCQARCQENKRNVPESPLFTARRGGRLCMQHAGPRNGAAILEAFPFPAILRPRFWGRFLAPFSGPRKSKQELLDGPDGPDFVHLLAPAFLLKCKPPWTHTHTHPYNTMRGHGAEAVLNLLKKSTFRGHNKPC